MVCVVLCGYRGDAPVFTFVQQLFVSLIDVGVVEVETQNHKLLRLRMDCTAMGVRLLVRKIHDMHAVGARAQKQEWKQPQELHGVVS